MPLTYLDIGLLAIMAISGILALMRGFTREVLSIASWGLAALAAFLAYRWPVTRELAESYMQPQVLAQGVLIGGTFLVVLIVVSFITARLSDAILDSRIGALDRTLGLFFGLARGFVIVLIAFAFFAWLVPEANRPGWVREARATPFLERGRTWLLAQLPDAEAMLERVRRPRDGGGEAPQDRPPGQTPPPAQPPAQQPPPPGQRSEMDRRGMDQMISNTGGAPQPAPQR